MTRPKLWRILREIVRRRAGLRACGHPHGGRTLSAESLESRCLLAALPYGALPDDTSEYMLGDVLVTVVLMESNGGVDPDSEQWTAGDKLAVKDKVTEGVQWWEDALARQGAVQQLDFRFDYTYLDTPVPTPYEPIARPWDGYEDWVPNFLALVGHDNRPNLFANMRAFNHAQRMAYGSDWAFTLFVVRSENDADHRFAEGAIRGSFAFTGGPFLVMPSTRGAETAAHETGHIFYALDEYRGGDPYSAHSGYYNTQNLNARDEANPYPRVDSIMSGGAEMLAAYRDHAVSPSAAEMVGWRDSDADGIIDVADVPHAIQGAGAFDPAGGIYRFVGSSQVVALDNLNPNDYSRQSDITLSRIRRAEYRVNGGTWLTAARYDAPQVELDLFIDVAPATAGRIEIRTVDDETGVTSPVFTGPLAQPAATPAPGLNGFVWWDTDGDGLREAGEPGLAGWTVELRDADGGRLSVEPEVTTVSGPLGSFATGRLDDGTYQVELVVRDGWTSAVPDVAVRTITVLDGATAGGVDFGVIPPAGSAVWHNSADADDVDGSGDVTPADFETLARALAAYGTRNTPVVAIAPYLDANGDGRLSLADARQVMLRLLAGEGSGGNPQPLGPAVRRPAAVTESVIEVGPQVAGSSEPVVLALPTWDSVLISRATAWRGTSGQGGRVAGRGNARARQVLSARAPGEAETRLTATGAAPTDHSRTEIVARDPAMWFDNVLDEFGSDVFSAWRGDVF